MYLVFEIQRIFISVYALENVPQKIFHFQRVNVTLSELSPFNSGEG